MRFNWVYMSWIFLDFYLFVKCTDFNKTITEQAPPAVISDIFVDSGLNLEFAQTEMSTWSVSILSSDPDVTDVFSVSNDLVLSNTQEVDRETFCPRLASCFLSLPLQILDTNNPQFVRTVKVGLTIFDINDNPPTFSRSAFNLSISEFSPAQTRIDLPWAMATDLDSPTFGIQGYELSSSSPPEFGLSEITMPTGDLQPQLVLLEQLNREDQDTYVLTLLCYDKAEPPISGQMQIRVTVTDINDNYPEFEEDSYSFDVPENAGSGYFVGKVTANDLDIGLNGKIVYAISSEDGLEGSRLFSIDPDSGNILVGGELDYEERKQHTLVVSATNPDGAGLSSQTVVVVEISDINDNGPSITFSSTEGTSVVVQENIDQGAFVTYVTVRDLDLGEGGQFQCTIDTQIFRFVERDVTGDTKEYTIVTATTLDRETVGQYDVVVTCNDAGTPAQTSAKSIRILVGDKNDNPPVFKPETIPTEISESYEIGQRVMIVKATDADVGNNAEIRYTIDPADTHFIIDAVTGEITLAQPLDYETIKTINFHVVATDQGETSLSATATVQVTVLDSDDTPPTFSNASYTFYVPENSPLNTTINNVYAYDTDGPAFNSVAYSLVESDVSSFFRIDSFSGVLFTNAVFDRENVSSYQLTVQALGPTPALLSGSAQVTVSITDMNDHPPVFVFPSLNNDTVTVSNRIANNTYVASARCTDLDVGTNAKMLFRIEEQSHSGWFRVNPFSGDIFAAKDLEINEAVVTIRLHVTNEGGGAAAAEASLYVSMRPTPEPQVKPSKTNQTTVIIIGVIAGFIVTILVVAIVFFFRRYKQKQSGVKSSHSIIVTANNDRNNLQKSAETAPQETAYRGVWTVTSHGVSNLGYQDQGQDLLNCNLDNMHDLDEKPKELLALTGEDFPDTTSAKSGDGSDSGHGSHDDSVFNSATRPAIPPRQRQLSVPPPYLPPKSYRAYLHGPPRGVTDLSKTTSNLSMYTNHLALPQSTAPYYRSSGNAPSRTHSDSFVPSSMRVRDGLTPELPNIPDDKIAEIFDSGEATSKASLQESLEAGRTSVMYLVGQPPRRVHYCSQV